MSQNVPNPFNLHTTIRYALPQAGTVRLCVYNLLGQRIRTLTDGYRSTGTYSVVWDGKNDSGRDVASGVYVYRLEIEGGIAQTSRMVLLRETGSTRDAPSPELAPPEHKKSANQSCLPCNRQDRLICAFPFLDVTVHRRDAEKGEKLSLWGDK